MGEPGRENSVESVIRRELAQELHDGVLQVLAGAGLKLETALRLMAERPEEARRQVAEVREVLEEEQRLIRFFVETYAGDPSEVEAPGLAAALRSTAVRVRLVWQVDVRLAVECEREPDRVIRHTVCRLVQEEAVNARRHGGASTVDVRVTAGEAEVSLRVADNGTGFPYEGRWEYEGLFRERKGPWSLRRRVESLGGTLALESGPDGATVEMTIPV